MGCRGGLRDTSLYKMCMSGASPPLADAHVMRRGALEALCAGVDSPEAKQMREVLAPSCIDAAGSLLPWCSYDITGVSAECQ
jgi:hypothetical protein